MIGAKLPPPSTGEEEDRQVPQFGWSEGSEAEYNSLQENCLVWSVRFGFNIGDSESSWQGASCCNSLQFVCQAQKQMGQTGRTSLVFCHHCITDNTALILHHCKLNLYSRQDDQHLHGPDNFPVTSHLSTNENLFGLTILISSDFN